MTASIDNKNITKKYNRCFNCSKKLGVLSYDCRCDNKFCVKCRLPESHTCTFNFKESGRNQLAQSLIHVVGEKIIKI